MSGHGMNEERPSRDELIDALIEWKGFLRGVGPSSYVTTKGNLALAKVLDITITELRSPIDPPAEQRSNE